MKKPTTKTRSRIYKYEYVSFNLVKFDSRVCFSYWANNWKNEQSNFALIDKQNAKEIAFS